MPPANQNFLINVCPPFSPRRNVENVNKKGKEENQEKEKGEEEEEEEKEKGETKAQYSRRHYIH